MITLAISTSSGQFAIIFAENDKIIYKSDEIPNKNKREILFIVEEGLSKINKTVNNISEIIVDVGPGGTSSVRTGIAFANSLLYSCNIPVYPVSSLELAGLSEWNKLQVPVITTMKSLKNNAYIGCFENIDVFSIYYGKIDDIIPNITNKYKKISVLGSHRQTIKELLTNKEVIDTGLTHGDISHLITNKKYFLDRKIEFPRFAEALNEQNISIFNRK